VSALTPCPIPAEWLLADAVARAPHEAPLGIWLSARRPLTVVAMRGGRSRILLIDGDLGRLLRRCVSIVVRLGTEVATVSADALIRVRALRVVAGLPYLPTRDMLHALFSDALDAPSGVEVPLARRSAEEVLAACAAARTTVLFSRVVYGRISMDHGGGSRGRMDGRGPV
jgi:hypothetical protein